MPSIVALVALLVFLLLIRSAIRLWNRRIEASLEGHLQRAREFAVRVRAEREAAGDALLIASEPGDAVSNGDCLMRQMVVPRGFVR